MLLTEEKGLFLKELTSLGKGRGKGEEQGVFQHYSAGGGGEERGEKNSHLSHRTEKSKSSTSLDLEGGIGFSYERKKG